MLIDSIVLLQLLSDNLNQNFSKKQMKSQTEQSTKFKNSQNTRLNF